MIKVLRPYLKGFEKYAILGVICIVAEAAIEIFMPFLMAKIIDYGIANKDITYVVQLGIFMFVMSIISLLLGVAAARFSALAGMGFGSQIRKGLFDKIQDFSFSNIDKFSTASLVTRCTTDVNNLQTTFLMLNKMAFRAPVMLICATIIAASINMQLVWIFLIVIPILGVSLFFIIHKAFPKFEIMLQKYDNLNASVQENLISIRVVKAFVRSVYEKAKFKQSNDALMQASLKAEKIVIFNMPIMQLASYFCIITILWFGGNMVIGGTMLTGELISFIAYVTQILMSLLMISMVFVNVLISSASMERIVEVFNEPIDICDGEDVQFHEVSDGSIRFENVAFSYKKDSEEYVLKNINLSIASGETIGILGGTGSSKTSLVQLIPRLYDTSLGNVYVGGRNVKEYSLHSLRDAVAMVLQKNTLFTGTIAENLRWGNEHATQEQLEEACKAACAHDFITSFPHGYETELEQGGGNVSGGQKQRLCIARALIKKPKIIILDDSTSAVDTTTDANIRKAFRENLKDTTTIIIAQRISSIQDADRILVLEDGQIQAIGTHDELLQNNQIYQEVYYSQQKGVMHE